VPENPEAVIAGLEVTREVRIEASPETIFPFFTDPEKLMRWMGVEAELDPQPGGVYRVHVSKDWVARGEFVAVEPFVRVAFTWGWENNVMQLPPGASLVEVTLEPEGEATVVRLTHSRLPAEDAVASHAQGWDHFLERLTIAAPGGDPGPDPWATGGGQ
jgi:uncharacterized protein YndB with AHSA1/START domain